MNDVETSKRQTISKREKVKKRVKETRKKKSKEAKKNPQWKSSACWLRMNSLFGMYADESIMVVCRAQEGPWHPEQLPV